MSQTSSYAIPNTTAVQLRQNLNTTLAALRSSASGVNAPTSPVIGQIWIDTTNNLAKVWGGKSWTTLQSLSTDKLQPSGTLGDSGWLAVAHLVWPREGKWNFVATDPTTGQGRLSASTLTLSTSVLPQVLAVLKAGDEMLIEIGGHVALVPITAAVDGTNIRTFTLGEPLFLTLGTANLAVLGALTAEASIRFGWLFHAELPAATISGVAGVTSAGDVGIWTQSNLQTQFPTSAASETVQGVAKLATNTIARTATARDSILTPATFWYALDWWLRAGSNVTISATKTPKAPRTTPQITVALPSGSTMVTIDQQEKTIRFSSSNWAFQNIIDDTKRTVTIKATKKVVALTLLTSRTTPNTNFGPDYANDAAYVTVGSKTYAYFFRGYTTNYNAISGAMSRRTNSNGNYEYYFKFYCFSINSSGKLEPESGRENNDSWHYPVVATSSSQFLGCYPLGASVVNGKMFILWRISAGSYRMVRYDITSTGLTNHTNVSSFTMSKTLLSLATYVSGNTTYLYSLAVSSPKGAVCWEISGTTLTRVSSRDRSLTRSYRTNFRNIQFNGDRIYVMEDWYYLGLYTIKSDGTWADYAPQWYGLPTPAGSDWKPTIQICNVVAIGSDVYFYALYEYAAVFRRTRMYVFRQPSSD